MAQDTNFAGKGNLEVILNCLEAETKDIKKLVAEGLRAKLIYNKDI